MEALVHQVLSGFATGGIYASLALALVMIYQSTHHINFAQGEMAMFSTYLAWTCVNAGLPYWAAFALTLALPSGRHSYMFVIDGETWVTDPSAPLSEDDGFGQQNAVINI